jgi:hypothetical protein
MAKPISPPTFLNEKIKFSFEYYDTDRPEYCISGWEINQIKLSIERLKDVNTKTLNDMRADRKVYHFGEVDWSRTTEKSGFANPEVSKLDPFHFSLLGVNGQKARVFGAYASGVFYIVWFDLNHVIWPSLLKHT